MKKILIYILLCTVQLTVFAQKKNFSMQDAVLGLSSNLAVANLKQLQWRTDNAYTFVRKIDSVETLVSVTVPDQREQILFDLNKWNESLASIKEKPAKGLPKVNWLSENEFYLPINETYYYGLFKSGRIDLSKMYKLPEDADHISFEPKSRSVAFTSNHNLYYCKVGGQPVAITKDGSENLLNGTSVHRDEFGIDHGIFWSPDGKQIAFYKMDQSMVADYPIINWQTVPASVKNIKYPMAGDTSHQVSLWNYNIGTQSTTKIEIVGPADQYITCVTWNPTSTHIYAGILNRDQNDLSLNKYNAQTGQYELTLLNEQNSKYVEPQHELFFVPNQPTSFIWWSQKDGHMHLYNVNETTRKISAITSGNWLVNEIIAYCAKTNELIITSTQDSPLEKNVYAVDLDTKAIRKLNRTDGTHTVLASTNGNYVIDQYTADYLPRAIDILDVNSDFEKRIFTANNTLTDYATSKVRNITLKASDKTKLYGKIMLPANFDSTKKYPTIVYLYNGPHVQLIQNKFPASGNLWYDYLTQNGYIVFVMDGRGSSNRGFNFESATHRQLGTVEMQDQMKGVEYLKSLPYVDTDKMGLHGWSYGGFMTTSIMLNYPDVFKAAVAGGPVMDWSMYEIMYTERYMDTPESNPDGFAKAKTIDKVKNLKGKLMLIHGTDDDVVVWQHSNAFLKSSVSNGVQVDYFTYPGHPHNVRGKDRVHLMQKITDYFDLHLKK